MNLVSSIALEDTQLLVSPRRAKLMFFVPFPELILALCFAATGALIAWSHGLAISLPSGESLAFTGMSYGVPLTLIGLLGAA
ncbi:MAG: hypothetical protein C0472_01500, partial [Erythrobacter sp.]|nr:hypothetical protein [Erythrobacter sp.]